MTARSREQLAGAGGAPDATTLLRAAGLRSTGLRRAVLLWLDRHPHSTAADVREGLGDGLRSISHQAVYDALWAFVRAELVRCIQPAGHPAHFERRVAERHHHAVCRQCGRIEDVDCVAGDAPCLAAGARTGFGVDEAEILFWGRCRPCART